MEKLNEYMHLAKTAIENQAASAVEKAHKSGTIDRTMLEELAVQMASVDAILCGMEKMKQYLGSKPYPTTGEHGTHTR